MKKLLLLALLCFGAWDYYSKNMKVHHELSNIEYTQENNVSLEPVSFIEQTPTFTCDGRQHCSQMTSYEEAKFFVNNCPNTKMDGDHDGEPCERQFSQY